MIEDIVLEEVKNNFLKITINDDNKMKNLVFFSKNNNLPFGVEEYKGDYCINFEVSNQSEFYKLVRELENNINKLSDNNLNIKSVFRKRGKSTILCKVHIKKNKNMIISKFINNKIENSIFEIEKNKKYNLDIEISGIWSYKDNCGLYMNLVKIELA